jgi:two-component system, NarL family, nitrate/nitrite response regulator NarL
LRQQAINTAQQYDLKRGLDGYLKLMFDSPGNIQTHSTLAQSEQIAPPFNRRKGDKLHNLGLSTKEQLVLKFLMSGMEDRDISSQLQISQKTVNHHVSNIMSKLGANNRTHVLAKIFSSELRN